VGIEAEWARVTDEVWANDASFSVQFSTEMPSPSTTTKILVSKKVTATFLAHHWSDRLESFQFVLSDIRRIDAPTVQILGQYDGRWFVRKGQGS
jgi:hypothetical protein